MEIEKEVKSNREKFRNFFNKNIFPTHKIKKLKNTEKKDIVFNAALHVFHFPFYHAPGKKFYNPTDDNFFDPSEMKVRLDPAYSDIYKDMDTEKKKWKWIIFNFLGWSLKVNKDKRTIVKIEKGLKYLRTFFMVPYNTLRLVTEFLPYLAQIFFAKSIVYIREKPSPLDLLLLILVPLYSASKLAYYTGRMITSPLESLRAAWSAGADVVGGKGGKALGGLFVILSLVAIGVLLWFVFPIGVSLLIGLISIIPYASPAAATITAAIATLMHSALVAKIGLGLLNTLNPVLGFFSLPQIAASTTLIASIGANVLKAGVIFTLATINYLFSPIGLSRINHAWDSLVEIVHHAWNSVWKKEYVIKHNTKRKPELNQAERYLTTAMQSNSEIGQIEAQHKKAAALSPSGPCQTPGQWGSTCQSRFKFSQESAAKSDDSALGDSALGDSALAETQGYPPSLSFSSQES